MKARITIANVNGIVADAFVNDFSINGDTGDAAAIAAEAALFYNAANAQAQVPVAQWLGTQASRVAGDMKVDIYERIPAGPDGPPIFTQLFTLGPIGANANTLPAEVAVVLSMNADLDGASNPRRRKGRVYIGPIHTGAVVNPQGYVQQNCMTSILFAADRFANALIALGASLEVWSSVDNTGRDVVRVAVDNAFDTMRKRGVKPNTRDYATVP